MDLHQLTANSMQYDVEKGKSFKCFLETLKHHEELNKLVCVIPDPEEHPDSGIVVLQFLCCCMEQGCSPRLHC